MSELAGQITSRVLPVPVLVAYHCAGMKRQTDP